MADQIFADGPIDVPAKYVVPGSSEIVPIAVQALLDGTNASGDFVPTLIFRSQAGHVIARVPTSTTVVAGGSAEVSWFPGVKQVGAASPAASALAWTNGRLSVLGFGDPALPVPDGSSIGCSFPHVTVSDATVFAWSTLVNTNDLLTFLKDGLYLVYGTSEWQTGSFPRYGYLDVPNTRLTPHQTTTADAVTTGVSATLGPTWTIDTTTVALSTAPQNAFLRVGNFDSVSRNVIDASLGCIYLGAV